MTDFPSLTAMNAEAEMRLLGSILIDNRNFHRVVGLICADHFGNALHGRIFEAIAEHVAFGKHADPVTLRDRFDGDPALVGNIGSKYLAQCVAAGLQSNPRDYAEIVVELARRRRLSHTLREMLEAGPDVGVDVITARIENCLTETRRSGPSRLEPIDPATLADQPVPERQWLVPDWIPMKRVTGLYGIGGAGKTLLMQMLATAAEIGKPWLGLPVRRCRSLLHFCEDDLDEMHARQADINRLYGCAWSDLSGMRWLPRLGQENTLMTFEQGRAVLTPLFGELLAEAKSHRAGMIVTDTLADVFGGNEIDRGQARRFVQEGLGRIAREIGAATIAAGHPSLSGIKNETGQSGSTGWDGAFRSRLYVHYPKVDESEEPDTNDRILTRKKSNWAKVDEFIEMRWRNGVFITDRPGGTVESIERRTCERVFLDMMAAVAGEGRYVSDSPHAKNYAPKIFAMRPDRERFKQADFKSAMQRLFAAKKIRPGTYRGANRHEHDCIILVPEN